MFTFSISKYLRNSLTDGMVNRILLVDDDEDDQEIFLDVIKDIDPKLDCAIAGNGSQAIHYLKENGNTPDMIFLDLNMPGMAGLECLSILKKEDSYKDIPVVIFTTSSNPKDIEETKKLGANGFFTKPSNLSKMRTELNRLLSMGTAAGFMVI